MKSKLPAVARIRVWMRKSVRCLTEHPWIPAILCGPTAILVLPKSAIGALLAGDVLSAIISASAILAGFFSTGMTILLALDGQPVAETLTKLGLRRRINDKFWRATKWLLWLAVTAVIAIIISNQQSLADRIAVGIVIFLGVGSAFASYEAITMISAILNRHAADAEDRVRKDNHE